MRNIVNSHVFELPITKFYIPEAVVGTGVVPSSVVDASVVPPIVVPCSNSTSNNNNNNNYGKNLINTCDDIGIMNLITT